MGYKFKGKLMRQLQVKHPKKNVLATAIDTLTEPAQMEQFHKEYTDWIRTVGDKPGTRADPGKVADANIGYFLGYYDKETADRWFKALPTVSHPIFGRSIGSLDPKDVFEAGIAIGAHGIDSEIARAKLLNIKLKAGLKK